MKDLESESLVHDNFLTVLSKCNVSMWNCKITFQLEGFEFLNCIFTSSLIYHTSMLFVLLKKKKKKKWLQVPEVIACTFFVF